MCYKKLLGNRSASGPPGGPAAAAACLAYCWPHHPPSHSTARQSHSASSQPAVDSHALLTFAQPLSLDRTTCVARVASHSDVEAGTSPAHVPPPGPPLAARHGHGAHHHRPPSAPRQRHRREARLAGTDASASSPLDPIRVARRSMRTSTSRLGPSHTHTHTHTRATRSRVHPFVIQCRPLPCLGGCCALPVGAQRDHRDAAACPVAAPPTVLPAPPGKLLLGFRTTAHSTRRMTPSWCVPSNLWRRPVLFGSTPGGCLGLRFPSRRLCRQSQPCLWACESRWHGSPSSADWPSLAASSPEPPSPSSRLLVSHRSERTT
jgi:hypothetical protein